MGLQGSGKGTQAKKISKKYNIPHISTGDMLRAEIAKKTALGERIKSIQQGELVPDPVIIDVIKDRINQFDCKNGFILDGFPRTIQQAKSLDKIVSVDYVIALEIQDSVAIERLSKRSQCRKCNYIYGANQRLKNNICKFCSGEVYTRKDDYPEAIKRRLEIYHKETEIILRYYENKNLLYRINGERSVEEVFDDITSILKK